MGEPTDQDDYQREILRLREENAQLRESSRAFGELAERLRLLLETERQRYRAHEVPPASGEIFPNKSAD